VSFDLTLFESVPYFSLQVSVTICEIVPPLLSVSLPTPASTVSLPILPVEILDPLATKPDWDFRYVYTHRPKILVSKPVPANPSPVDVPPPPPSTSPSDLDISITLQKDKRSCTDHPILNFVSYDHLNPIFRQFALFLSSEFYIQVLYRGFIGTYLEAGYG